MELCYTGIDSQEKEIKIKKYISENNNPYVMNIDGMIVNIEFVGNISLQDKMENYISKQVC